MSQTQQRRSSRVSAVLLAFSIIAMESACGVRSPARAQTGSDPAQLRARPGHPSAEAASGLTALGIGSRDTYLYVPKGYRADHPAPLVILLHGATQSAQLWTSSTSLQQLADSLGLVLLMPNSLDRTWDLMRGGFGRDVALLDSALAVVFRRVNVDPRHIALAGFSDGASYALSLGVSNGDLFQALIAFSPGFFAPGEPRGKPKIFIAHGTRDQILPIDAASRTIVPELKRAGYDVTYHEFDGPHTVKPDQMQAALIWFLR